MNWLMYFQNNRAQRMSIPWERGIHVEQHLRDPLVASLQRFQVGEQGDGNHLKRAARATGDPDYARTIDLFIEEEQEHARLLAKLLEGMNAPLMKSHWSDVCFVLVRRVMGLKLELMVLLAAELIAKRYYRALHEGTNDLVLKTAFAQILSDELGHVAFHCDYLQRAFAPLPPPLRSAMQRVWRLFFRSVCLVVMFDHRGVLHATGVPMSAFWRDCGTIFDGAAKRIFALSSVPDEAKAGIDGPL